MTAGAAAIVGRAPLNRYGGEKVSADAKSVAPAVRPPPAISTRPSGSSSAVDWYPRGSRAGAAGRHVSVAGSQISDGRGPAGDACPSWLEPPTASTDPSARTTR